MIPLLAPLLVSAPLYANEDLTRLVDVYRDLEALYDRLARHIRTDDAADGASGAIHMREFLQGTLIALAGELGNGGLVAAIRRTRAKRLLALIQVDGS